MATEVKRLLASVPPVVFRKIKLELVARDETMQDAIVRALAQYLNLSLSPEEQEQVNLLHRAEEADRVYSEVVNG